MSYIRILMSVLAVVFVMGVAGCDKKADDQATTENAASATVDDATLVKVAEIAATLEKSPEEGQALFAKSGMTFDEYKATMATIAADPELTDAFIAKKQAAGN